MENNCTDSREENGCDCGHQKHTPRDENMVHNLHGRLNRIIGQLNGIKNMLDSNRYCGDILVQISAAENALQSIGYMILQNHLETCVSEEIKNGNEQIIDEAVELIKKLK